MCFDNARKGRKSGQLYQNDAEENLEAESRGRKISAAASPKHERCSIREEVEMRRSTPSPFHPNVMGHKQAIDSSHKLHGRVSGSNKQESEALKAIDTHRPRHDRRSSREEGDMRRFTDSPLHHDIAGRRVSSGDNTPRRVSRQIAGSNRSVEPSPLHPHSQLRVGGKNSGYSSPSWERKATSEGSHSLAPSTPGRCRLSCWNN